MTILRATFTQNVVDGHGGAISLTGMGLKVNTSGTVAFTGNIAEGGKGGAVFLNQGAQLSGNGTHFEGNTGVIGGAVSLNVRDSAVFTTVKIGIHQVLFVLRCGYCCRVIPKS